VSNILRVVAAIAARRQSLRTSAQQKLGKAARIAVQSARV